MFSRSYHSELSYIRELCRMYSDKHASTQGLLGERGADPDVERLLQGFAFLAAGVRERIEDEVPEIVHDLIEAIAPQYLRPLPSCTIVEFSADVGTRERKTVKAGTEVVAEPIEGTACRFRTTADLEVLPLSVEEVILDGPRSTSPTLRLRFTTGDPGAIFRPEGLRLFLHGEYAEATTLLLWLTRHCRRIDVRSLDGRNLSASLPPDSLSASGLRPDQAVLPWPQGVPPGSRLAMEYFTVPHKFLFVDLRGLDAARAAAAERFEVAIGFDRPLVLAGQLNRGSFLPGCVPAINLFPAEAERVRCEASRREYHVRPAGLPPQHAEVYTVDAVTGLETASKPGLVYTPLYALEHATRSPDERPCFRTRRRPSVTGDGPEVYLSITAPSAAPSEEGSKQPDEEVLSAGLTCTNGALPGRLGAGDILKPVSKKELGYENITEVTKPVWPPLEGEVYWRLAGNAGLSSFEDPKGLVAQLALHDFHFLADPQGAGFGRGRIEAVRSVARKPLRRIIEGIPARGVGFEVGVDEAGFAGRGDVFLFGCILTELLAAHLTCNSFVELRLFLQPSAAELAWGPRVGDLPLV
jgi:type VI secretion system protein ImpG